MRAKRLLLSLALALGVSSAIADDAPVVAQARGNSVTERDFNAFLQLVVPQERHFQLRQNSKAVVQAIQNLLLVNVLATEATKMNLENDSDVKAEIELSKKRILATHRKKAFDKAILVPDMEKIAQERYRAYPNEFSIPEQVRVAHILVSSKKRSKEEARKLAESLHQQLIAGADFAILATQHSDDSSAQRGGELGFFSRGKMVKPFEDAAFAMTNAGQLSGVVETDYGYHILKYHEREAGKTRPYDEIRAELTEKLRAQYMSDQWFAHTNDIMKDVIVVEQGVAGLLLAPIEAPPTTPSESTPTK